MKIDLRRFVLSLGLLSVIFCADKIYANERIDENLAVKLAEKFVAVNGVTDTEMTIWGLGITQNVDAAASQLYLGYRHFDADINSHADRNDR